MAFCFDSLPCVPLSSWCWLRPSCYPVCQFSLLTCTLFCPHYLPFILPSCLLSDVSPYAWFWRFSSSRYQLFIWPNIVCLFFLVLSVWRTCFCILSFFLHTPAPLGLWSALCLGFSLPVCSPRCSSPSRFLSARARRSLWISAAAGYCRLAATLPHRLGWSWTGFRAVQADCLLAVYAVRLIFWDWVFSVFSFLQ